VLAQFVQEFADAGADEGDAEQDVPVEVDDHPGGVAPVTVGVQVGALGGVEVEVDGLDAVACLGRLLGGQAHGGGFGVGEEDLGDGVLVGGGGVVAQGPSSSGRPAARAPMASPAVRAWYLP
jgi:hypothetical protein